MAMMTRNILAALDEWLETWPGGGCELSKPDVATVPATVKAAANDPAPVRENTTSTDRAGSVRESDAPEVERPTPPVPSRAIADELPWRALADAYYRHHFGCLYCIAAGQNPNLDRCAVGKPLWDAYRAVFAKTNHQSHYSSQRNQS